MRRIMLYVVFFMAFMNTIFGISYASVSQEYVIKNPDGLNWLSGRVFYTSDGRLLAVGLASNYIYIYDCDNIDNSTCNLVKKHRIAGNFYKYVNQYYNFQVVDNLASCGELYIFYLSADAGNYRLRALYTNDNMTTWGDYIAYSNTYLRDLLQDIINNGYVRYNKGSSCGIRYISFVRDAYSEVYIVSSKYGSSSSAIFTYDSDSNQKYGFGSCIKYGSNSVYCAVGKDDSGTYLYYYPRIIKTGYSGTSYAEYNLAETLYNEIGAYARGYYDKNGNLLSAVFTFKGVDSSDSSWKTIIAYCKNPDCVSGSNIIKKKFSGVGGAVVFIDKNNFIFTIGSNNYLCSYDENTNTLNCNTISINDYGDSFQTNSRNDLYINGEIIKLLYSTWSGTDIIYKEETYDTKILIKDEISGSASNGKIEIFGDKYFSINTLVSAYLSKNSFSQDSIVKVYNDYISRFYFYKNFLTAYLLNVSETPTVQVVFQIQPATSDVIFRIKKITSDGLITIHEQKPDATGKVTTYLAQNNVYYIYIEDSQGERVIGNYIASYATTETIYLLGSSSDSGTSISLSVSKDDSINNVKIKTEYNVTQGYIRVTYDDTTNSTQYVELHIYNETNDEVFFANSSQQSVVFNFVNATINSTYYIKLYAKRNTTDVVFTDYIRFYESEVINIPIKREVLNIMVLLFIVAIALLTPQAYRKQGIMLMTAIIVLFNVFGWLSLSYYFISLIVFIALLVVLVG